jgi:hypothetical protein
MCENHRTWNQASSVVISAYLAEDDQVCEPDRIADEIICENMAIFCANASDWVNLRIVAAGEQLIMTEISCEQIVSATTALQSEHLVNRGFDFNQKQADLNDNPEDYAAGLGEVGYAKIPYNDHEEGADADVWFSFAYGTFERSNEEICFSGDHYPYMGPSCYLQNSGLPVATQIHNPQEYAIDPIIQEMLINADYNYSDYNTVAFNLGSSVDLTNQVTQALQGYVNIEELDQAIPTSITINSLPSCGALWRTAANEGEEEFAVFWSYNQEASGFVVQVNE